MAVVERNSGALFDNNRLEVAADGIELRRAMRRLQGLPANYKEGESQAVYPLRRREDIAAVKDYFWQRGEVRNWALFVVGINVGLRAGDLLAVQWQDVAERDGRLKVREEKTGKYRVLFANEAARDALRVLAGGSWGDRSGYIFCSARGGKLGVRSLNAILKRAAAAVGVERNVGTHTLRKTFGYHQFKAHKGDGRFLAELQRLFNHSSQEITLRYIGIEEEDFRKYYEGVNL